MDLQRESRFFRTWASLILRFRPLVILLLAVLAALSVREIRADLQIETSPEYFAKGSSDASETLDAFRADFGRDDQYLVLVRGDVFSQPFLDKLRVLHDALKKAPIQLDVDDDDDAPATAEAAAAPPDDAAPDATAADDGWGEGDDDGWGEADDWGDTDDDWGDQAGGTVIEEVTSLVNFRQTVFEGGGLRVRGLMDQPVTDVDAFRSQVLADPTIVGSVVGAEGKHAVLVVRTAVIGNEASRQVQVALQELVKQYSTPDFDIVVTGMPALEYAVSSSLMRDMRVLIGVAFLLMGTVLFILFRHPIAVIAPLVVVGLSIIFTLATMAATGTPVTLLTNIVPAFLICVGLGDSVHVQSVYRDQVARGVPWREAVVSAVGSTGMPVLFTTLTTMVGLLSFRSASTLGIQELGMVAAFGVFIALVMSIVVIPVTSGLIKPPKPSTKPKPEQKRRRDIVDKILSFCTDLSDSPPKRMRVFLGALALSVIAAIGISQVRVFHDPLTWLPTGHPTQTSIRELDEHVGGTSNVVVVIESQGDLGVKDVDLLQRMEALDQHVKEFEHPRTGEHIVGNSMSIMGIVKETNRALHEGDPAFYALPDDQRAVSDNLLLFESAGPEDLRRVATADLKKTHITFRLDWMDASSLLPLSDHLGAGIRKHIDRTAVATVTGTAYSLVSTVGALIGDMMKSFGLAVVVIAIMMTLLLRNAKLAGIALIPNLLPVAFILGFMGFVGIPIDMATLLIASIVIGIAVDTTIHYLHQFRVVYLIDHDLEGGIRHALSHAGRALVGTSVILAMGFGAYMASEMANVRRFGILVSVACGFALFTNLILVPALLRTVYGGNRAR